MGWWWSLVIPALWRRWRPAGFPSTEPGREVLELLSALPFFFAYLHWVCVFISGAVVIAFVLDYLVWPLFSVAGEMCLPSKQQFFWHIPSLSFHVLPWAERSCNVFICSLSFPILNIPFPSSLSWAKLFVPLTDLHLFLECFISHSLPFWPLNPPSNKALPPNPSADSSTHTGLFKYVSLGHSHSNHHKEVYRQTFCGHQEHYRYVSQQITHTPKIKNKLKSTQAVRRLGMQLCWWSASVAF